MASSCRAASQGGKPIRPCGLQFRPRSVQHSHFAYKLRTLGVRGPGGCAPSGRCGISVHRRQVSTGTRSFRSLQPWADMLEFLFILIALVAAAASSAACLGLRFSMASFVDVRPGQASKGASHSLGFLLRSLFGCRVAALAAVLARPAPAAARQEGTPRWRFAAPPPGAIVRRRPSRPTKP